MDKHVEGFMKRVILIFLLSFSCLFAVYSDPTFSDSYEYLMVGFVDTKAFFSPTIFYDVLPFDLDGADVRYNSNKETQVQGLAIGSYSLISNTSFHLYVSHSPLVLKGQVPSEKLGSIDYRLYLIVGISTISFCSCLSDEADNAKNATNKIVLDSTLSSTGMVYLRDKYIYVSLEDAAFYPDKTIDESTEQVIGKLAPGTYQSTIYFMLEEI